MGLFHSNLERQVRVPLRELPEAPESYVMYWTLFIVLRPLSPMLTDPTILKKDSWVTSRVTSVILKTSKFSMVSKVAIFITLMKMETLKATKTMEILKNKTEVALFVTGESFFANLNQEILKSFVTCNFNF